jgi:hypothetical protein
MDPLFLYLPEGSSLYLVRAIPGRMSAGDRRSRCKLMKEGASEGVTALSLNILK